MSKIIRLTKEKISLYKRIENNKITILYLNAVRKIKADIENLNLEIKSEKEKQCVKISSVYYNVKVTNSINNNRTPLDRLERLEHKKKLLLDKYYSRKQSLLKILLHKNQGVITDILISYYIDCKSLEEMSGVYNIDPTRLGYLLHKYSIRLNVYNIDSSLYDKNLLNYKCVDVATNVTAFLFKQEYNLKEYDLLNTFVKDKDNLYYDVLFNYIIRYELNIDELSKIYRINISELSVEVCRIIKELEIYLKDNKYLK